jgi:hypothetical protein
MYRLLSALLFLSLFFSFLSCSKGSETIGLDLTDNSGNEIYFTDTITVVASTVQSDTFSTGSSGKLLVGRYRDSYTGLMETYSYFNVEGSSFKPDSKAVFDSLTLTLKYNYSYADTNQTQTINVHRLQTKLDVATTYYNTSSATYEANPVGKSTFKARPVSGKPLIIRLNDSWGAEILAKAKAGEFGTSQEITDYFRGFALVPGASDEAAVLGFQVTGDSAAVKLYYHTQDLASKTASVTNFSISTYFNQIKTNTANTAFQGLKRYKSLPASQTNEEVFMQSGSNVYVRLDFPYLKNLNLSQKIYLNAAQLIIDPVDASLKNKTFALPSSLYLSKISGGNKSIGSLSNTSEAIGYQAEDVTLNNRYYIFFITQHIYEKLTEQSDTQEGLLVSIPSSSLSVSRLVAGSNKHITDKIKLKLFYTKP